MDAKILYELLLFSVYLSMPIW